MTTKKQVLTAIKNKCREDCCAGDMKSWSECKCIKCALYPYRMRKDPKPAKGVGFSSVKRAVDGHQLRENGNEGEDNL